MAYLHLNGVTVPVRSLDVTHEPIAQTAGYSPNGVYQHSRNGFARVWKVRSGLLDGRTRLLLADMIGMRGDSWRFNTNDGVFDTGVGGTSMYSDRLRVGYNSSGVGNAPIATTEPTIAADGSPIYDTNEVANRPWVGCTGVISVNEASNNRVTSNQYSPATTTGFLALAGATLGNSTSTYVGGVTLSSLEVTLPGSGGSEGWQFGAGNAVTGYAQYSTAVYVKLSASVIGKTVRLQVFNLTSGATALQDIVPTSADYWYRMEVANFVSITAVDNLDVRVTVLSNSSAGTLWCDLVTVESDIDHVTSPIDPAADVYGAGVGVRPFGDLQYQNLLVDFTKGMTFAAWVKRRRLPALGDLHYVFSVGSGLTTSASAELAFNSFSYVLFNVRKPNPADSVGYSGIGAADISGKDEAWHHYVATYDPNEPRATIYTDGVEVNTSTSVVGSRTPDMQGFAGDLHIGNDSSATSEAAPGLIANPVFLPFVADASFAAGLYNAASGYGGVVPGVEPIAASGSFLDTGESGVLVYTKLDATPHAPYFKGSTFVESGGEIAFTMHEAVRR